MSNKELSSAIRRRVIRESEVYYPGVPLAAWFSRAPDEELRRINAYAVADTLGVDRARLLATLIRLVRDGVLDLNWDFHCTHCSAVAGSHRHLREATAEDHCPRCKVSFRNELDRNVEVTFTPVERLHPVDTASPEARMSDLPEVFVSGLDCLHVPEFGAVFETESLSLRESLRINQVSIMFTDIKGSTTLYERLGDAPAYALVRDHFDVLFREVERNGGVIVKTIGDSVMASFKRPSDAVESSLAIQEAFGVFNRSRDLRGEVLVKVGIHAGGTIMVNLNNRVDYFGHAVNLAARIQGTAGGGEIVVSAAVRNDTESLERMRGKVRALGRRLVSLKGITGEQEVYVLKLRPLTAGRARPDRP